MTHYVFSDIELWDNIIGEISLFSPWIGKESSLLSLNADKLQNSPWI